MTLVADDKTLTLLDEKNWTDLVGRIKKERCTPIIGPEARFGNLAVRDQLARDWAGREGYLLDDCCDLARVIQFVATKEGMGPADVKDLFIEQLRQIQLTDAGQPDDPHAILASLPLPVFITTNHDDLLLEALKDRKDKDPRREICRWNEASQDEPSDFGTGYKPTVANPVVFHLFGHADVPDSMILSEDDHLDFLVAVAASPTDAKLIPPLIEKAFTDSVLLFLGYRVGDLDFRILLRFLVSATRYLKTNRYSASKPHLCVLQLADDPSDPATPRERLEMVREYLNRYCDRLAIKVFWGSCRQFLRELKYRWKENGHDN